MENNTILNNLIDVLYFYYIQYWKTFNKNENLIINDFYQITKKYKNNIIFYDLNYIIFYDTSFILKEFEFIFKHIIKNILINIELEIIHDFYIDILSLINKK
jgi:hypothetical protein